MQTTIDKAGRLVIPKALRDRLGWLAFAGGLGACPRARAPIREPVREEDEEG